MSVAPWGRNLPYLASRLRSVGTRYGVTPRKARDRVVRCVDAVGRHGVLPTFATPGRVVDEDGPFFAGLAAQGVEIAVHGYDHVNFRNLAPAAATAQFERALASYARHGIPCDGFRCPYLSYTPELDEALPDGAFLYGSNRAIAWEVEGVDPENPVFAQLASFYGADSSETEVSLPTRTGRLIEIPVTVPDDLELCDAMGLGEDGLVEAWLTTFEQIHARGELFSPLFHPESFDLLEAPVGRVLAELGTRGPAVWLTQLRDVARWWQEREGFEATIAQTETGLEVLFTCSKRATVLAREWPGNDRVRPWAGRWGVLDDRRVRVEDGTRPFVGAPGADTATVAFLRELGYVVDATEQATSCTVVLDPGTLGALPSRRAVVEHIEATRGPLLRLSPWPSEARSAFCFSGDLDALSLRDYARRIVRR